MILWHPKIHEEVLHESLVYYLLSFAPIYRGKEISEKLTSMLLRESISSYCAYEIYGLYDLVIRVWLPSNHRPQQFTQMLFNELKDLGCSRVLPFFVREQYHWPWWNASKGEMSCPNPDHVKDLHSPFLSNVQDNENPELLMLLQEKNLLYVYDDGSNANCLKVFVSIPPPMPGLVPPHLQESELMRKISDILRPNNGYEQSSLYCGDGFAWFLIKTKINYENYGLVDKLTQEINELGVQGFYIRTFTYLTATPHSVEKEGVVAGHHLDGIFTDIDLNGLQELVTEESKFVEIKGSVKLNINRLLHEERQEQDEKVTVEFLKNIVAFLNSEDGGIIIVGLLESEKYPSLKDIPTIDSWILFGTNVDYQFSKNKNYDSYRLMITDTVKDRISAEASWLISLKPLKVGDRDVVLVRVPSGIGRYYLDNKHLFVRRDGSSIALEGREREDFISIRERRTDDEVRRPKTARR